LRLDAAIEELGPRDNEDPALVDLVQRAWALGKSIDLDGVSYGPEHSRNAKLGDSPSSYYYFLAGLVRMLDFRRILEIGTHYGGSISAMLRSIEDPSGSKLVTVDRVDTRRAPAGVVSVIGDCNGQEVVQEVVLEFGAKPIDFLFIDADHRFTPTLSNLGVFASLLRPTYIALDDILLNRDMSAMWSVLRASYGRNAINCVDIEPGIRPHTCGFGLIRLDGSPGMSTSLS
jgi:predicted O-methyltransferase YrrM